MNYKLFLLTILFFVFFYGNDSHQLAALEQEKGDLILTSGMRLWGKDVDNHSLINFKPFLGVEYAFNDKHRVSTEIFGDIFYWTGRWYDFSSNIAVSYRYITAINSVNLIFGPDFSIPIIEPDAHRYGIGLSFAATGATTIFANTIFREINAWYIGMQYAIGLPRKEDSYASWQPGNIQITGNLILNENESLKTSLGIQQNIYLPGINVHEDEELSASTLIRIAGLLIRGNNYLKSSLGFTVVPLGYVTLELIYGHKFNQRK
jgi:hypothetical protein